MKQIGGEAKTIRELLSGQRYEIDYYQREYRWQRKQVQELIDDLGEQFSNTISPTNSARLFKLRPLFPGFGDLSKRDGSTFIVDGQQRLTT
jgi:uncharacterized protein with ParB-like and HNH nuclease domain